LDQIKSEINTEKGRSDELRKELRMTKVDLQESIMTLREVQKEVNI